MSSEGGMNDERGVRTLPIVEVSALQLFIECSVALSTGRVEKLRMNMLDSSFKILAGSSTWLLLFAVVGSSLLSGRLQARLIIESRGVTSEIEIVKWSCSPIEAIIKALKPYKW